MAGASLDLAEVVTEGARMKAYQKGEGERNLALLQANATFSHEYSVDISLYAHDTLDADVDFQVWSAANPNNFSSEYTQHFNAWHAALNDAALHLKLDLDDEAIEWTSSVAAANAEQVVDQIAFDGARWQASVSNQLDFQRAQDAIQTALAKVGNNAYTSSQVAALSASVAWADASAQAISTFERGGHLREKSVLTSLNGQSADPVADFLEWRVTAERTWDQNHIDPLLALRHDLALNEVSSETTMLNAQRDNANATADLKSAEFSDIASRVDLAIADLAGAQDDYAEGALNAAKDYQLALVQLTHDTDAGTATTNPTNLYRAYAEAFIDATQGPRRLIAEATQGFSIAVADLELNLQNGISSTPGLADLDQTLALATNTTQFAQYDNGIDADYNGKLAASEDRADWMAVLSVQHPGALSQADADMTGLAYQRFLTGSGLADRNAALAQSAADLLAANTNAGAVHTASEAQAVADRAAAVQAANDLFASITGQIESNVAQGQFYVPPWSPAPLSPFGQFGGYLAGSADISGRGSLSTRGRARRSTLRPTTRPISRPTRSTTFTHPPTSAI